MKIFKFGGASVKNAEGIKNLAKIINQNQDELVLVVSAMGKTTNLLEQVHNAFIKSLPTMQESFNLVKDYHYQIVNELFGSEYIFPELNLLFNELNELISKRPSMDRDFEYDKIVSFGELFSTRIVFEYLKHQNINSKFIDIRDHLKTDSTYRDAKVDWDLSGGLIKEAFNEKNCIHITQGYIGSTVSNISTTLGREGSDYSAAILAYILKAESVTIWKDVPGILNADPRWYPQAIKINEISYSEAIELAYYGAQVIHPKTIKPLQNRNIPLYVKPFDNANEPGTIIHHVTENISIPPIFIRKENQVLISISPKDFSFIAEENLSDIFARLAKYRIKVNLMQNSAISFSIVADNDESKIFYLIGELRNNFRVLYNQNLELLTIRHYTDSVIETMIKNTEILLQQKSRNTARFVLRKK